MRLVVENLEIERKIEDSTPLIRLKSVTLKGLTDHIRFLHIGYFLGVFDLVMRLFFLIFA